MNKVVRHGEIVLKSFKGKVSGNLHSIYIVGHSESGHHHVIESETPFTVSESDKQFVIELFAPAKIVHKKTYDIHPTIDLPAGKYTIGRKTEYDPIGKISREVWD